MTEKAALVLPPLAMIAAVVFLVCLFTRTEPAIKPAPVSASSSVPSRRPPEPKITETRPAPPLKLPPELLSENAFSEIPNQTELGEDHIVVEAERFQSMSYGWEIGRSKDASGGCYIHMKEGIGDFESEAKRMSDPKIRSGDFYNITRDSRPIEARCYFLVPKGGEYFVSARTMAHRKNCSNVTYMSINGGGKRDVGKNGTTPFVWLRHDAGRVRLKEGANFLSLMAHQDDVKVDQIVLSPVSHRAALSNRSTFKGGFPQRPLPEGVVAPVNLSLSANTLSVTGKTDPKVLIYVHKNVPDDLNAELMISLDLPGGRKRKSVYDITLKGSDELLRFPFTVDLPRPLKKKEYLLTCALCIRSKVIEKRTAVLFHGYDWSVLGPLPYMRVYKVSQPEMDLRQKRSYMFGSKSVVWRRYDEKHTDQFCLLDLGMMLSGRTYDGVKNASLYVYTEVEAGKAGRYLLKVQGDDHIIVWVNRKRVIAIEEKGPPIRTAREIGCDLEEGRNRILLRLNQKDAKWQAGIRIRTIDDKVADVIGIPFSKQDVDFYSGGGN